MNELVRGERREARGERCAQVVGRVYIREGVYLRGVYGLGSRVLPFFLGRGLWPSLLPSLSESEKGLWRGVWL